MNISPNTPPVPVRYWAKGMVSREEALQYKGIANQILRNIQVEIGANPYSALSSKVWRRNVTLQDGTILEFSHNHVMTHVTIIPPWVKDDGDEEVKGVYDECFCNEFFATCKVIRRVDYSEDTPDGYIGDNVRYDLEVCNKNHIPCYGGCDYIFYHNMMISDFADVVPDEECLDGEAIEGNINFGMVVIYDTTKKRHGCGAGTEEVTEEDIPFYKVMPIYELPLLKTQGGEEEDFLEEWTKEDEPCL